MPIDPINGYYYDPNDPDELGERISLEAKYYDTKNEKMGYAIQAKDVIMLDAPEVLLSPNTPLLTNAQDVAGAINELFNEGGGGGDDDWYPPESWINIPEPAENQIIILVDTYFSKGSIDFTLKNENGSIWSTFGGSVIDWGDGTTTTFIEGQTRLYSHTYNDVGQYIITITSADIDSSNIAYFQNGNGLKSFLAIKIGVLMGFTGNNYGPYMSNLVYMKFKGKPKHDEWKFIFQNRPSLTCIEFERDYPEDGDFQDNNVFANCSSLKKAPFTKNLKTIPNGMFNMCGCLENVDLSSAVTIDGLAFNSCFDLKEINAPMLENMSIGFQSCFKLLRFSAPKLTSIQSAFNQCYSLKEINTPLLTSVSSGFNGCYGLQKFIYADNCDFNGITFNECPQLYPKPQ